MDDYYGKLKRGEAVPQAKRKKVGRQMRVQHMGASKPGHGEAVPLASRNKVGRQMRQQAR